VPKKVNAMQQKTPRKLLDQVSDAIRLKHYSYRTEQTYKDWIKRYIIFQGKRHPKDMGIAEIQTFLSHLAVEKNVAASTQNPCTEPVEVRPSAPSSSSIATSSTSKSNSPPTSSAPKNQKPSPSSSPIRRPSPSLAK